MAKQEVEVFNKRIVYNKEIIDYIFEEKLIFKKKYDLIGIINTPKYDHYNVIIINLLPDFKNLKPLKNYIYDGMTQYHDIRFIEDLKNNLMDINQYIAIYVLNNN